MVQWAARQPRFAPKGRAAGMASVRPLTDTQLQASALTLARQAVEAAPTNSLRPWYQLTLGAAEYRNGCYLEAGRMLSASEVGGPSRWHPNTRTGTARFFGAMIMFQQGHQTPARRLFSETEAKMQPVPAAVEGALAEGADYDDLMRWLAYKEARELLNGQ